MEEKYAIEMLDITKRFPGVLALDNVTFRVKPGTVHALMGENGAGKSTLMKCLFGIYKEDNGIVKVNGQECHFAGSHDALKAGVSMIHQELSNVPERTVAENMWLGREPLNKFGLIDHKKMLEDTEKVLTNLSMKVDPKMKMKNLSISNQQACEIAKAVSYNSSVVVMDEPTSSLTENEVDHLFEIINNLREKGVAIVYISHKMEEIFKISDYVSVMRDGKMIGSWPICEMTTDKLISYMVGRESTQRFPDVPPCTSEEVTLKVSGLSSPNPRSFKNVSLELHKGEILGIGGLVGAQRTEFVEAIFGVRDISEGEVYVKGKRVLKLTPKNLIAEGVGFVTEDRRGSGIFPLLSITKNTSIASLSNYKNNVKLLDHKRINNDAEKYNSTLKTKTPSMDTLIQNLSGGNQQKVILSRWLMTVPDILIMDEPTRGIDVGAKFEIYTIMSELVKNGKSIIMISSEMPELIGMSHRIMVLCEGNHTGTLEHDEISQEAIMRLATQFC